ncbi:hypothetical protein [Yersinia mollaretii]|uniref:hypothetical protein n=1 Tax=Yersinia mollaretii TaxID=33060 RepID=UPI001643D4D3
MRIYFRTNAADFHGGTAKEKPPAYKESSSDHRASLPDVLSVKTLPPEFDPVAVQSSDQNY